MTYQEKLLDQRWLDKRDEILARDKYSCVNCYSKTRTLNVHHTKYIKNREPWEYDNSFLITLCRNCHEAIHGLNDGSMEPDNERKELEAFWGKEHFYNTDNIEFHKMTILKKY
jgi:5-methylcytosine-specific restriction endonuclease McrA